MRSLRRWCVFNLVGFLGITVQLACLFVLRSWIGLHYMLATALAVESAVLHNYFWHEHWTWADRTGRARNSVLSRLARFNLTTGVVSISSNLVLMGLLVDGLGIHYLAANLLSITLCSAVNFLVSDHFVFLCPEGHSLRHGKARVFLRPQGGD